MRARALDVCVCESWNGDERRTRRGARSTFSVIFHVPSRRLSQRWIVEMEFAPRYFTSCVNARARGRHVPINIEDYNPKGVARGIDLNFALCTKAPSTARWTLN